MFIDKQTIIEGSYKNGLYVCNSFFIDSDSRSDVPVATPVSVPVTAAMHTDPFPL